MRKLNGCLFLFLFFFSSSILLSQTVDTSILGSVTDPQGSVIPDAVVVVHAEATGQEKSVKTTGDGQYRVQYLVPGIYSVTVNASGFAPSKRSGIQLALSQQIHIDVAMSLSGTERDGGCQCNTTTSAERKCDPRNHCRYQPHGQPSAQWTQVQ